MTETNPSRKTTSLPVTQMTVADGNWDTVRDYPIRMIVIHTIVGSVNSANIVFNSPRSQRSTHYGVGLDGKLYQWVDEDNVAYQAGKYAINQYSIGIEHEDNGNYNAPRTDALYESSSKLVAEIASFYNIALDRDHVKKHSEVSSMPTSCPDSLDIERIIAGAVALAGTPRTGNVEVTTGGNDMMPVLISDWRGLLVEAGSLERIASIFGFSQADCKDDIDVGMKIVEQVNQLRQQVLAKPLSTNTTGNTPSQVTSASPATSSLPNQPIPPLTPVQKNWFLAKLALLFG